VEKLKSEFATTEDAASYVAQQGSVIQFYDAFLGKSKIQVPVKDSIFATPKGSVYGPYLDGSNYVLARVLDVKEMPDSAKARHILIQTNNPQTGEVLRPDSVAKIRIDSIRLALASGISFDTLAQKLSDDKSSAERGGLLQIPTQSGAFLDYFTQGQMVRAFNDSVFNGKVGDIKLVRSEFGWHLIEILDLKNIEPHYKIAYLAKPIYTSNQTDQAARNKANLFAGNSRDLKAFNDNYDKTVKPQGIVKLVASDLTPMTFNVNGINGSARPFIKKVFEMEEGEVFGPERVGDNYVVAVVTDISEPGLRSVNSVRPEVEPILKNKKKADQIIKNIGQVTTLEQVAAKVNQQVQTLDSIRFSGDRQLGYEPKVLGAAFNPANKGKVVTQPLAGTSGVFVIRVENVGTTPVEGASIEDQRKMLEMQAQQGLMNQMQRGFNPIIETLKQDAKIKDNRAKFY
jgi:peptidyl-prolyl cis-trans isomerase D